MSAMSYDVTIYYRDVKGSIAEGLELDELPLPSIPEEERTRFRERLLKYGYESDGNSENNEFIKTVESCPIQVIIFDTEISFSVPYWKNAEAAIAEAIQDATELSDSNLLVLYNPQTDEWTE